MENVADFADDFARRARNGEKPKIRMDFQYAEAFLGQLARLGLSFAKESLDEISDPRLRRVIETLFFSTVAGAAAGLAIGMAVEAIPVAKAVAVGAAVGCGTGLLALVIVAQEDQGRRQLVFTVR